MWIINYLGYFAYRITLLLNFKKNNEDEFDTRFTFSLGLVLIWVMLFVLIPILRLNKDWWDFFSFDPYKRIQISAISILAILTYGYFLWNDRYIDIFKEIDLKSHKERRFKGGVIIILMLLMTVFGILQ